MARPGASLNLRCASMSVLFVNTTCTAAIASAPKFSALIHGKGKEFKTSFYDAHLLGMLSVPGDSPVLAFFGAPHSAVRASRL